jgi:hypothetical protein
MELFSSIFHDTLTALLEERLRQHCGFVKLKSPIEWGFSSAFGAQFI